MYTKMSSVHGSSVLIVKTLSQTQTSRVVVGGDFNIILDQDLDGRGRNKKRKDSVQYVEDMIIEHDFVDIWRIRNLGY